MAVAPHPYPHPHGARAWRRTGGALLAGALLLGACTSDGAAGSPSASSRGTSSGAGPELPEGRDVVVTSITDGDTFRAGEERVRLTGIDTPEVSGPVECFGTEATEALRVLIPPGSEVRLVFDVDPVDRYGRTLAYVYRRSDALLVNLALADDGFALPLTVAPNVALAEDIAAAARRARERGRGLWAACGDPDPGGEGWSSPPTTTPSPPPATAPAAERPGCEPAYPDVCIPPGPPDLDCADITERGFTVLPPDPHHFDGGGDGRGCERS